MFVDFLNCFSTTTPTPSHRRVVIFSTTTQGRNFFHDDTRDSTSTTNRCFFHDDGHYGVSICNDDVIWIFPSNRTCPELYPETFCLSKVAPSVVLLCFSVTMVARLNWNESFSWAPALRFSRESLEFRLSAPAHCCIAGCPQRRRRRLWRGSLTCWLMKTCLCVTFNISHRVFHLWPTRNVVQPNDLTFETFSVCKFLHTKPCLRTLIWLMRRLCDVFTVTAVPIWNFLTYGHVSVYNVWHASPCLCPVSNIISHPFT